MGVNVEEAMSTENNEEQMGTHEPRWGGSERGGLVGTRQGNVARDREDRIPVTDELNRSQLPTRPSQPHPP